LISWARTPWREAILLPGAGQMKHARTLIESRPMLVRVPAPDLIVGDPGKGTDHIAATRAQDGSYAFIYSSSGRPFTLALEKLSGAQLRSHWLDPRGGEVREGESFPRRGQREFRPPSQGKGQDWVLILDDASRDAPPPGPKAN